MQSESVTTDGIFGGDPLIGLAAGVSPKIISEQLGHTGVAFTLGVRSHVLPHMQDAAAGEGSSIVDRSHGRMSHFGFDDGLKQDEGPTVGEANSR
jgi:hypothetical protein